MNDDNWFINVLRDYAYERSVGSPLNTQNIYDMLKNIDIYRKDTDMSWGSFSYGRYDNNRSDEVATATLEAYAKGVPFETFLKKNATVRDYWYKIEAEKVRAAKARAAQTERERKMAEKKAIEQAKREEVMTKLTSEELEAFGFAKKGKKK